MELVSKSQTVLMTKIDTTDQVTMQELMAYAWFGAVAVTRSGQINIPKPFGMVTGEPGLKLHTVQRVNMLLELK